MKNDCNYILTYFLSIFAAGSSGSRKRQNTDDDRKPPKRARDSFEFFVEAARGRKGLNAKVL